jgi:hypothetical protein
MHASNGAIDASGLPRSGSKPCATPRCRTNSPPFDAELK